MFVNKLHNHRAKSTAIHQGNKYAIYSLYQCLHEYVCGEIAEITFCFGYGTLTLGLIVEMQSHTM